MSIALIDCPICDEADCPYYFDNQGCVLALVPDGVCPKLEE